MYWQRPRSLRPGRLGRAGLALGAAAVTVGGLLLGAGAARAAVGKDPGHVELNPASGQVTSSPTWSTDTACAAGFQGSAVFRAVKADGTTFSISAATNSVATPFSGTLQAPLSAIKSLSGVASGGAQEFVVLCFSGPSLTGRSDPEMDIALHYSADGATYTTDTHVGGGHGLDTTTTLVVSPDPVTVNQTVTLIAAETAPDGSDPAGSIQFEAGGTAIGPPVAVGADGVATTTTTFTAAGAQTLSAAFTPADAAGFNGSTGSYTETVQASGGGGNGGSEPIVVTIPGSQFAWTPAGPYAAGPTLGGQVTP